MPQQIVREEIVKGAGTQFDPQIAKVMQHLIDVDEEYNMKEREEVQDLIGKKELICTNYRREISDGIRITSTIIKMRIQSEPTEKGDAARFLPTIVLFDSLDGRVHTEEKLARDMVYFEYAEVRLDGHVTISGARTSRVDATDKETKITSILKKPQGNIYDIEAVKYKDHLMITIDNGLKNMQVIIALPDSTRYVYMGITGENCHITEVTAKKQGVTIEDGYIPRIAPEISFIDGPAGDIPNVQVDGFRTAFSEGVAVRDKMEIRFHTMSLPTARLIWHCPFIVFFTSRDGRVEGENYIERAVVRLDGECWTPDNSVRNQLLVSQQVDFEGWNAWKDKNKAGYDCVVTFERTKNEMIMTTENLGIQIRDTIAVDAHKEIYVALSGDQCALTDIRISNKA